MDSITVIGGGRLGGAAAEGLASALGDPARVQIVQRPGERFTAWQRRGFRVQSRLTENHQTSVIIVAVKPKDLDAVLADIAQCAAGELPIISLASGFTLAELRQRLPARLVPYRARANVFVAHRAGSLLLAEPPVPAPASLPLVQKTLGLLGTVHTVSEAEMVRMTWYSSSVPIVIVGELLRHCLEQLDDDDSSERVEWLLRDGIAGLATWLAATPAEESDKPLAARLAHLVGRVATPGGMNHTALSHLAESEFWDQLAQARAAYLAQERAAPKPKTS